MLKVWIVESFPSQKAYQYATYTAVQSVCVRLLHMMNQLTESYNIETSYI